MLLCIDVSYCVTKISDEEILPCLPAVAGLP
jgi:hypothetical protein